MSKHSIAVSVFNDTPGMYAPDFGEALQQSLSARLPGLRDERQADLYARIMSGVEQGVGTKLGLLEYEINRTHISEMPQ